MPSSKAINTLCALTINNRNSMIARLVRRHTSMGLEWIAAQLHMGVRSSVTRAEKDLQRKLAKDKVLAKH
ncbi:hypothetical protein N8314_02730 [Akkermansiaceae bacterium]|nr:hypothetical protein [Akkermansiaceae bacterium]